MAILRTLARLVLIASVSGVLPQAFAWPAATDAAGIRATSSSAAVVITRSFRLHEGSIFTKAGVRADLSRHKSQRTVAAALTSGISLAPPGLGAASVAHATLASPIASRPSAPLRGPPQSI